MTQAIGKLEREAAAPLFVRTPRGLFLTAAGELLAKRIRRAIDLLDPALCQFSPRFKATATTAQLRTVIAMCEAESFTLAARRLGVTQPTVHRAITQLEQQTSRPLFERTSYGMIPTRPTKSLASAARLAFTEVDQADADLAELIGREVGRIVIGAMPLARSYVLPRALAQFRALRPTLPVTVLDGSYDDLLAGLRRGEIDVLVGALREPAPIGDVEQAPLFHDGLVLLAHRGHPLACDGAITLEKLAAFPWIVPRAGTPTRAQFDKLFAPLGPRRPRSIIESGSIILMRELLGATDHLGCISRLQAEAEVSKGLLVVLPFPMDVAGRPIGLTARKGWNPTQAQRLLLSLLHQVNRPRASAWGE